MSYIDGFVLAVPTENKDKYAQQVHDMWPHFKSLGATRIVECWGDDVPEGEVTSMLTAVQCKPDETVMFSWIEWPSKEVRDIANEKMMTEGMPGMDETDMPFDGKRMILGGFTPLVILD